ncbi:ORF140 [Leucania separata nucleopolyhedrovirus]|uniref:ORF140 n=1 Tax=Leucania separata nucleopolyhedrovirus TaxID=1307956 RepID=Q0IKX9_NPVLS|nr:ORF140 [Leucania separata nucleopolyhedrovirus]AAR28904.1 ORF140 [Leucania separata nucleopolyhedrovirus]
MIPSKIILLAIAFATFVYSWHCSLVVEEVTRVSRSLNAMSQRIDLLQRLLLDRHHRDRTETLDMTTLVINATRLVRIVLR